MTTTRIWSTIEYEKNGRQVGCLRVPISTDSSAYGSIPIPILCLKNGEGRTAVLIAGTHGDEYEGQVALMRLARGLAPEALRGRIIILPSLNFPAVQAGRRVSPIDEGNLNRLYPGRAHGTATEMIAHYVTEVLLPMADLVVDLHSGGRSLDHTQCALIRRGQVLEEHEALLELLRVFGAPVGYLTDGAGGGGDTTLSAAAQKLGVPLITAELGGGGTLDQTGTQLAEQGTQRLLKHLGVAPKLEVAKAPEVRMVAGDVMVYAESTGLFEPFARAGDEIRAGQLAGFVHSIDYPADAPEEIYFPQSGLVASRRFPAFVRRGDCVFEVVQDVDPSFIATGDTK